jgi:hypothetical protein
MFTRCVTRGSTGLEAVFAYANGFGIIFKHTDTFQITPKVDKLVKRTTLPLLKCQVAGGKGSPMVDSSVVRMQRACSIR